MERIEVILRERSNITECKRCLGSVTLMKNLRTVRCRKNKCRFKFPLINEIMHNSKLKNEELFEIIHLLLEGSTNKLIKNVFNVNNKTLNTLRLNLTPILMREFRQSNIKIGGPGIVVEVDETKMGKRKFHKGRRVEGVWIFGLVEKTISRKIVCFDVPDRTKSTLQNIIRKYVDPGSIIHTDGFKSYLGLGEIGYTHRSVNHKYHFVDPITLVHTNTIEGNWCGLKTLTPKRYRTRKLIDFYLLIFMFKRNYEQNILEFVIKSLK